MRDAHLTQVAEKVGQQLADILSIETIYSEGNALVILGTPKVFTPEFEHLAKSRLMSLGYPAEMEIAGGTVRLSVITGKKAQRIPWLNIVLFLLTVLSTLWTGAMYYGQSDFLSHPERIVRGWPYSFWLLSILTCHEFGHYLAARRRKVKVTLPYFIPAPTLLGTMGAFIRAKSPFKNRGDLLEVGAWGPVAGFVVSIMAICVGLKLSEVVPEVRTGSALLLGDSLLFSFLSNLVLGTVPQDYTLMLDPIAFAGWVGLLVTMLNLLPIGQLDGGHILYALFGRRQLHVAWITLLTLVVMSIFLWSGWALWIAFGVLMRPGHPPTLDDGVPLNASQKALGWASVAIFIVSFIPAPIS